MFKKLFKKIKDVAGDIAPYAGLIASGFGLGPLYSTLIGAGVPLVAGQDAGKVMSGGLGGYFGGKTFGSKGAGTYISPLDMIKNKGVNFGGTGGMQKARDLALDRLKGAASFSGLKDDNPFKYAPGVLGGLTFASGLGLFGDEEVPQNRGSNFVYNPDDNTLDDIQSGFFQQAQDFDYLPNVPGGIEDYLRKIGLLANGGRSFKDGDMTTYAAPPPDPNNPEDLELILNNMVFRRLNDPNRFDDQRSRYGDNDEMLRMYRFTLDPDESKAIAMELAKKTGVTSDSPEFEEYRNIIYDQSLMIGGKQDKERRKLFGLFADGKPTEIKDIDLEADTFESLISLLMRSGMSREEAIKYHESVKGKANGGRFAEGGVASMMDPNLVGGDRINPTGGRILGRGAGREDLLEGEIVDPNSGKTQEIRVSNNEHVIPEYALFAMGGGNTEKGQQMMDDLRAKTKPMAKQMGYDFEGAEDGSMNYAPIMAQDGTQTRGPNMDMRKMIQKLMAQGKSIEEIMAIIQRLNTGSQTKQQQMPMMAADGVKIMPEPAPTPNVSMDKIIENRIKQQELTKMFQENPSEFTKMFGLQAAEMMRKKLGMRTQKSMEEDLGAVFRPGSAELVGYNIANGIGTDQVNGLERMSRNMQDGSMTADPMMTAGLGSVVKGLEDAQQMSRMIR